MPFCGMRSFSVAIFACETKQVPGKGESFRWGDLGWDSQDASVDNCTTILLATKTHPKPPSKLMSAFTPPFHGISRYHRGKCQLITEVTSWSRSSDLRIRHKTNSRRHPKWKEIQYWFKRWYHTQLIFVFGKVKWMTWDFFFREKTLPSSWVSCWPRHRIYLRKRAIKLAELKEAQGVAKKVGIFKNQPLGFFWCFSLYRKNV